MSLTGNTAYVPAHKRPVLPATQELSPTEVAKLPPWLEAMRSAMSDAIKPADLTSILTKQVEKAKAGDVRAAAFVVDQANKMLAGEQKRPVTITQNNFYGEVSTPDAPAKVEPGTNGKLSLMQRRRALGLPLNGEKDAPEGAALRVDDDEAEKSLRRRESESEED